MQAIQKALLVALFMSFAGVAIAAAPAKSQVLSGIDSGTTQQAPDSPKDCKKNPQDPRCDK